VLGGRLYKIALWVGEPATSGSSSGKRARGGVPGEGPIGLRSSPILGTSKKQPPTEHMNCSAPREEGVWEGHSDALGKKRLRRGQKQTRGGLSLA